MRIFFKLFWCAFVVLIFFLLLLPYISPSYRGMLNNIVKPILPDLAKVWLSDSAVEKENLQLREKVGHYEAQKDYWESLFEENQKLRDLLDMGKLAEYESIIAGVSVRSPLTAKYRFIIDKGEQDGLAVGMPVLVEGVLLGRIVEVKRDYAVVGTLAMQNINVYCRIKGTDYAGKLSGEARSSSEGKIFCDFTWLPRDVLIKPGMVVLTSGYGADEDSDVSGVGMVPRNLRVGLVRDVFKNEKFQTAVVEVTASWQGFEHVIILKKKEVK